ncbi:MAG: glycosyl hydrolase family 18 protein [Kouleothrix sp.]|jgi:spore germination protein YaaH
MTRRIRSALSRFLPAMVFLVAMLVWVALLADTVGLAQQASSPPVFPTTTAAPQPTQRPLAPVVAARPADVLPNVAPTSDRRVSQVHPKTGRYIAAWLPDSFDSTNRQSFEANADILDEVSPFWYSTDARGNLLHGADARDQTLIELAHSKNVLVLPTIHNIVNGTDPIPAILSSPERRRQHVRNIVQEVVAHNYDGIDIDYELLDSSMRAAFSAFVTELGTALHAEGKQLTIAVHAKTSDYGGLGGFQDWSVIGPAVDRMRIMTYDYHWRGGGPGPVAPVYWVREVAEYAKATVDPAKVVIGVPFYGYNWPTSGDATPQIWEAINDLIQTYGLTVNFAESDANGLIQENWITYKGRKVWFATSRGLEAKISLVQELDLAGIAIWRLGGEDPKNWEAIRAKLVLDPFESQRMLNGVLPEH